MAYDFNLQDKGFLSGKRVLIIGGTGSLGKALTKYICQNYTPERLIIFSRDELKQFEMSLKYSPKQYPFLRYVIGDVRDKERLYRVTEGVDYIIHAAALKQVPAGEYNPSEAIKTNVLGAMNIIDCAIENEVDRVVALSTDKACNPINLYGATKLCSDKLFISANELSEKSKTRFCVVRYGNVVGSRGSVVPFFLKVKSSGVIPITDPDMTRFFITLEQGVKFVLASLKGMFGGELFVPKIGSMRIVDIAKLVAPECKQEVIGIRPGEKLHEMLISVEEGRKTYDLKDRFVIAPEIEGWGAMADLKKIGHKVSKDFSYASDSNAEWFTAEQMKEMITNTELEGC